MKRFDFYRCEENKWHKKENFSEKRIASMSASLNLLSVPQILAEENLRFGVLLARSHGTADVWQPCIHHSCVMSTGWVASFYLTGVAFVQESVIEQTLHIPLHGDIGSVDVATCVQIFETSVGKLLSVIMTRVTRCCTYFSPFGRHFLQVRVPFLLRQPTDTSFPAKKFW